MFSLCASCLKIRVKLYRNSFAIFSNKIREKSYYDVLDVPRNASQEDLKLAYLEKCKQFHPDRNRGKNSHSNFVQLKEAYNVLSNEKERQNYDFKMRGGVNVPPSKYNAQYREPYYKQTNEEFEELRRRQQMNKMNNLEFEKSKHYVGVIVGTMLFVYVFFIMMWNKMKQIYSLKPRNADEADLSRIQNKLNRTFYNGHWLRQRNPKSVDNSIKSENPD